MKPLLENIKVYDKRSGTHYSGSRNFFKLLKLAYRNLFRNKRRSFFAILITVSGCTALCLAAGYYRFSIYSLQELTIRNGFGGANGTGHVQIMDKRTAVQQEGHALDFGIDSTDKLTEIIKRNVAVDYVLPRIEFGGLVSNGDKSAPFKGYGIDVDKEIHLWAGLSEINPKLKLGEQLTPLKKTKTGIILGKELASVLNAKTGDILMLYVVTPQGTMNGLDVELLGIMSTGVRETDKYYLLTTIDVVHKLVTVNKISLLSVMFKNRDHFDAKIKSLEEDLKKEPAAAGLKLTSWEKGADFYISIRDIFNIIFTFMGSIIIVIVFLSCWNIMNMTTMERIREIGTLRAIGLSVKNISTIFLLEALLIGITGVITGLLIQFIISRFLNRLHIIMPPVPGMSRPYTLQVYGVTWLHPWIVAGIIIALTASSFSSFLLIKRFSIVQSLEHT